MGVLAPVLTFILLSILVAAAVGKLTARDSSQVFEQLFGLSRRSARTATIALAAAEWLTAALFAAAPGSLGAGLAVGALFGSFALVGAYGLVAKKTIECHCFGAVGGRIGWRQVLQFLLVIVVLTVVSYSPPSWSTDMQVVVFALAQLLGGLFILAPQVRTWSLIRAQRHSLGEAGRIEASVRRPVVVPRAA